MNIFKSKLLWLAPVAAILLLAIFALAFYPAFNPKPKEMPIAIVNNDKGVDIQGNKVNIGKKIEDKLMDSDSDTVKWVKVDKESDIKKGLEDEKYYGAAIFNKDFSKDAMSKTQKVVMDSKKAEMKEKVESGEVPAAAAKQMQEKMGNQKVDVKKATFKTIVNKGASMQASQITGNVLDGMGNNLNKQITSQSLKTLEKQDVKVNASDIKGITNPVKVDDKTINKVKDHQGGGNAPFLMFMPVWMSSLVTSVLLFFAFRTSNNFKIQHRIIASLGQMLLAVITAFVASFAYVYFMHGVLGFEFGHTNRVAIFLAISILGFIGLILGIMVWLGMKSIPIFVLLMFFSMQLITLPKQMLPKGYQTWVYDIDPFTHYTTTLRQIIYMGHPIEMNSTIWMMIGLIIFGAVSSLVAAIVRKHSTKRTEIPA
ncbi:ABC transporter permease [Staphylococcus caledonicus]|uniref:ABC transporter permease n=1 Tax=Staphylococcus caledonicus TaxID=2741333 RepID=UPI0018E46520|nr:ABC transporter permease [Staphylococcus caledonicus]MBI5973254.1 ABC transporter permease [Staphylococcus caledonicus]